MSADNMLYIQYRDGKWWVWEDFASRDGDPRPRIDSKSFTTQKAARDYAFDCSQNGYYEYGVNELPPYHDSAHDFLHVRCPACGTCFTLQQSEEEETP